MPTKIQWTDKTDNPIYLRREDGSHGGHWCRKASEGCGECYAERINQSGFFKFASHLPYTGEPPENLHFDESIVQRWAKVRSPNRQRGIRFHQVRSLENLFGIYEEALISQDYNIWGRWRHWQNLYLKGAIDQTDSIPWIPFCDPPQYAAEIMEFFLDQVSPLWRRDLAQRHRRGSGQQPHLRDSRHQY